MDAFISAHPVIGLPLAVMSQIPEQSSTGHADRHGPKGHPSGGGSHILLHQRPKDDKKGNKLECLKNTPQELEHQAFFPCPSLLSGKGKKTAVCVKHVLSLLPAVRCPWPVCVLPTYGCKERSVPAVRHVSRHPKHAHAQ